MRLRAAYFAKNRHSSRHFLLFETTADQYVLLSYLAEEEGITQQQLSTRCSSDAPTIGTMIELLQRNGLVERQPHPSDRRAWLVFLTNTGWAHHAQLRKNSEEIRDVLNGTLEPEELAFVQKALDRIAEPFRNASETPNPTPNPTRKLHGFVSPGGTAAYSRGCKPTENAEKKNKAPEGRQRSVLSPLRGFGL
jgi:DNA-binding MarR family transcriptional regulator